MNSNQSELLNLLKKFDAFCEDQGVTYYLGGGTALGAIRHRGFIPWDDDVDLYITRDNAEKLRQCKKALAELRISYIDQKEFPLYGNTIIRLAGLDDTMFHSARMIDEAPKGRMLELFILDPVPRDHQEKINWKKKQWIYTELIDTAFTATNYNKAEYIDLKLYKSFLEKCKEQGRESVLLELEKELFSIDEQDCNEYCIRWCGNDICFEKNWVGTPRKVVFEDMLFPILPGAEYAFRVEYGNKWMYVPEEQETKHAFVFNKKIPYSVYVKDYYKFIDKEKLTDAYSKKKKASLKRYIATSVTLEKSQMFHSHYVIDKLQRDIQSGKPKDKLYETWKNVQLSTVFKSTKTYLNIGDAHLHFALLQMIALGEYEDALSILCWKEKNIANTGSLKQLYDFLFQISEAYMGLYRKDFLFAQDCLEKANETAPDTASYDTLYLELFFQIEKAKSEKELMELLDDGRAAILQYPNKPELLFLQGNIQKKLNNTAEAKLLYEKCAAATKNGMIRLYSKDYVKELSNGDYND